MKLRFESCCPRETEFRTRDVPKLEFGNEEAEVGPRLAYFAFAFSHISLVITQRKPRWLLAVLISPLPREPIM